MKENLLPLAQKRVTTLLDSLSFFHILLLWCTLVASFGVFYYFASSDTAYLYHAASNAPSSSLRDHIYFSFIVATSTGLGDILPVGWFKFLAMVEVVSGLLLLAFVTSKLVSIKQDIILGEVYEISFHEKIHRVRSSLLLFRQNAARLIDKIDERLMGKRDLAELHLPLTSFHDVLHEITLFVTRSGKHHFTKALDPLDMELIANSVIQSWGKLSELISSLERRGLRWKSQPTIHMMEKCFQANQQLFDHLRPSGLLTEQHVNELRERNTVIIDAIKTCLGKSPDDSLPQAGPAPRSTDGHNTSVM